MTRIQSLFLLLSPLAASGQAPTRDTVPHAPKAATLQTATVTGHTPLVQRKKDRVIINVEV
ncbi:MAG TPA: hypothetical protein VGQ51_14800, partial [Puia sp.]|nr:hypothetical protein [Puia sp.]